MLGRYLAVAVVLLSPFAARADVDVPAAIQAIKAVGREGAGNEAAAAGWKQLVGGGGVALFPTLKAFDGASPTAANWLRSAIDGIAQAEKKAGRKLPTEALIAFVKESQNAPAARRIAFELIADQDKTTANGLLESMVNDPSLELRRDAIAAEIEKLKPISAALTLKPAYEKLFAASRDPDQIEQLAKLVEKVEGKADITKHMGFITKWQLAGPFDSPMGAGFGTPYPPEKAIDLTAEFRGKTPSQRKCSTFAAHFAKLIPTTPHSLGDSPCSGVTLRWLSCCSRHLRHVPMSMFLPRFRRSRPSVAKGRATRPRQRAGSNSSAGVASRCFRR